MADFHFLRPAWLLALIPLLFALWWLRTGRGTGGGAWRAVCDAHLIPYVIESGAVAATRRGLVLTGIAGGLAITALAGPVWKQLPQPVYRPQSALVVMLDLSRSMDAADIKPSRLERARLKLRDLLQRRREGQTALVVYAGDAFAVTPLTGDTETISLLVQSLSTALMPVQGSRPDRAVDQALALLSQAGARSGSLLLITDGVDAGRVQQLADQVVRAGHRLSVLGTGTPEGAPVPDPSGGFVKDAQGQIVIAALEERLLAELARSAGGLYTRLGVRDDDVDALLLTLEPEVGGLDVESSGLTSDRWREEGPWLVLLLLPVALLAFRRGLLVVILCVGVHWSDGARALEWNDLWFNADQRGMKAMEARDFELAAQRFKDARWKSAAMYRSGDFEGAVRQLEGMTDPEANYNRGNALARAGRIDEAMRSYEQTLQQQPDHADARYNLDLLRQLQQQRQAGGEAQNRPQQAQQSGDGAQDRRRQSGQKGEAGQGQRGQSQAHESGNQPREQPAEGDASGADARQAETADGESERLEGEPQAVRAQSRESRSAGEEAAGRAGSAEADRRQSQEQQAMEQWLRRVPDDPGGLLRRKFQYQYSQREREAGGEVIAW
jgi:Ca-activated chloride channel family protein